MKEESWVPALGFSWLTPLYDGVISRVLPESEFKKRLVAQADISYGQHVMDLGCGTGTLMMLVKACHPGAMVWGVDMDRRVIKIAKDKALKQGLALYFHKGLVTRLDYPDRAFHRVLSSLLLHHLTRDEKLLTLLEARRILAPGGEIHIADWGRPRNALMRLAFLPVRVLDGFARTEDNVKGLLPDLMERAGFADVRERESFHTLFGTLSLYSGRKDGH